MVALLITYYNQKDNIEKILNAVSQQSVLPDKVFLLLDRASVDECNYLMDLFSNYELTIQLKSCNEDRQGFQVGYVRNKGIDIATEQGYDKLIFIDGDCIPQKNLVSSHLSQLQYDLPVITSGRRREQKYQWKDQREVDSTTFRMGLFKEDKVINSPDLFKDGKVLWGCNFGINSKAIKVIKQFNTYYYGRHEVFNSVFDGEWGGEDIFLGITAYQCRVFVTTLSNMSSGIQHIEHPSPPENIIKKRQDNIDTHLNTMRKLMSSKPIKLSMFN